MNRQIAQGRRPLVLSRHDRNRTVQEGVVGQVDGAEGTLAKDTNYAVFEQLLVGREGHLFPPTAAALVYNAIERRTTYLDGPSPFDRRTRVQSEYSIGCRVPPAEQF